MNDHRLKRLKRLAAGAALVTATLTHAGDPPKAEQKPNVNSPPEPEPVYVNSPAPVAKVDAGTPPTDVKAEPKPKPQPPTVNSPPKKK